VAAAVVAVIVSALIGPVPAVQDSARSAAPDLSHLAAEQTREPLAEWTFTLEVVEVTTGHGLDIAQRAGYVDSDPESRGMRWTGSVTQHNRFTVGCAEGFNGNDSEGEGSGGGTLDPGTAFPADFGLPAGESFVTLTPRAEGVYAVSGVAYKCPGEALDRQQQSTEGPLVGPLFLPGTIEQVNAMPAGTTISRTYTRIRGGGASASVTMTVDYTATKARATVIDLLAVDDELQRVATDAPIILGNEILGNDRGSNLRIVGTSAGVGMVGELRSTGTELIWVLPKRKPDEPPLLGRFELGYVIAEATNPSKTSEASIRIQLYDCVEVSSNMLWEAKQSSLGFIRRWCYDGVDKDLLDPAGRNVSGATSDTPAVFNLTMGLVGLSVRWSVPVHLEERTPGLHTLWSPPTARDPPPGYSESPRLSACVNPPVKGSLQTFVKELPAELLAALKEELFGVVVQSSNSTAGELLDLADEVTGGGLLCWTILRAKPVLAPESDGGFSLGWMTQTAVKSVKYSLSAKTDSGLHTMGEHADVQVGEHVEDGEAPTRESHDVALSFGCSPYESLCVQTPTKDGKKGVPVVPVAIGAVGMGALIAAAWLASRRRGA